MGLRLTISALALGAMLLAIGASAGTIPTRAGSVTIRAALNSAQEVPAPTGAEAARGSFTATAKRMASGWEMSWTLVFDELTGPATAAHIHLGARGEAGEIALPLCSPCRLNHRGTRRLDVGTVDAINASRAYVNIHTAQNPAGEVRGQIETWDKYAVTLRAGQQPHTVVGTKPKTKGGFTATIVKTDRRTTIRWRLSWFQLTGKPLAANIHVGERGKVGRRIFHLCGDPQRLCTKGRFRNDILPLAVRQALEAGNTYVSIRTRKNPKGEVRAQLRAARLTLREQ